MFNIFEKNKSGKEYNMNIKSIKKLISSVIAIGIVSMSMSSLSADAYSATRTVDNDTNLSGYGNINENNAYLYITGSSLFNSDARVTSSNNSSRYYWTYPVMNVLSTTSGVNCHFQAYLNHSSFTDNAKYYVATAARGGDLPDGIYNFVGTINQDNAPAGWSDIIIRNHLTGNGGRIYSKDLRVHPSGESGKFTGADEIKVRIIT